MCSRGAVQTPPVEKDTRFPAFVPPIFRDRTCHGMQLLPWTVITPDSDLARWENLLTFYEGHEVIQEYLPKSA